MKWVAFISLLWNFWHIAYCPIERWYRFIIQITMHFSPKPCQLQASSVLNSYLTDVCKVLQHLKNLDFLPVIMSTYLKATCIFPFVNYLYIHVCFSYYSILMMYSSYWIRKLHILKILNRWQLNLLQILIFNFDICDNFCLADISIKRFQMLI